MSKLLEPFNLYGVPFSQPVRAVMWLMLYKRLPFKMVLINPGSSGETGSRNAAYLAKNPGGTIPCLEDPITGYALGEAHAIMGYLCNRFGWDDVYPSNPESRGKVDWYLHFHHRTVREASIGLVAPRIRKDLDISQERRADAQATLATALQSLEEGWLKSTNFLVGDEVTLADFAAYVELGQLQPKFTNVFDFANFPQVSRWLKRMGQIEGHDEVHVVLAELGDISKEPPSMDTIRTANKEALKTIQSCVESFV